MDSEQVGLEIRQAAAVYFKNYIMRNWVPDNPDKDLINQQDRALIKKHLAELMLRSPKLVQTQLSHALAIVSKADFPKNWPELLPVSSDLTSSLFLCSPFPFTLLSSWPLRPIGCAAIGRTDG